VYGTAAAAVFKFQGFRVSRKPGNIETLPP
jgi:hypothetical protein